MNTEPIKLIKSRDFGELINAPLTFYKQEFKLLIQAVLYFAGPFFLASIIISGYFLTRTFSGDSYPLITDNYKLYIYLSQFIEAFGFTMLYAVVNSYLTLYVERGKDNFILNDIWQKTSEIFWKIFGMQFVAGIVIIIGGIFLFVPGIYLAVALSFVFIIIAYEKLSISKAFSRSFQIIKDNWWFTFGLIIVFFMIILLAYIIVYIPFALVQSALYMGGLESGGSVLTIAFSLILTVSQLILVTAFVLMIGFTFFSFLEQKESPELLSRVNAINPKDDFSTVKEELPSKEEFSFEKENEKLENEKLDDFDLNRFKDDDDFNRFKPKY